MQCNYTMMQLGTDKYALYGNPVKYQNTKTKTKRTSDVKVSNQ